MNARHHIYVNIHVHRVTAAQHYTHMHHRDTHTRKESVSVVRDKSKDEKGGESERKRKKGRGGGGQQRPLRRPKSGAVNAKNMRENNKQKKKGKLQKTTTANRHNTCISN